MIVFNLLHALVVSWVLWRCLRCLSPKKNPPRNTSAVFGNKQALCASNDTTIFHSKVKVSTHICVCSILLILAFRRMDWVSYHTAFTNHNRQNKAKPARTRHSKVVRGKAKNETLPDKKKESNATPCSYPPSTAFSNVDISHKMKQLISPSIPKTTVSSREPKKKKKNERKGKTSSQSFYRLERTIQLGDSFSQKPRKPVPLRRRRLLQLIRTVSRVVGAPTVRLTRTATPNTPFLLRGEEGIAQGHRCRYWYYFFDAYPIAHFGRC